MLKTLRLLPVVAILLIAVSCEKMLFETPDNHTAVFEYIWQYTKDHYCCFDFKEVDWNEVYDIYAPQVNDDMETTVFTMLMHEMLSTLKDNRLFILGEMGTIRYEGDTIYPENIDTNTVKFYNPTNGSYAIYEGVAYFNNFDNQDFFEILDSIKNDVSGLIIDIRSQLDIPFAQFEEGEYTSIVNFGREAGKIVGKRRTRIALRDDYEEVDTGILLKAEIDYEGDIVVLCNWKTSFWASELVYFFSQLSGCTLVGDHTIGGNFMATTTYLANGWVLNIPTTTIINLDGQSIGEGIAPDIYINDDPATTDVDEIIEAAIDLLN